MAEGGRYFSVKFAVSPGMEWNQEMFHKFERAKRGVCTGFSFGSRRRMLDKLNQISTAADLPAFVTLTLPDDSFDDSVTSFAKTAKVCLDNLLKRLRRVCPSACGLWRIEWKARKSGKYEGKLFPHFHLLLWGVPQRSIGWFEEVEEDASGYREIVGVDERFEAFVPVRDKQSKFEALLTELVATKEFKTPGAKRRVQRRALNCMCQNKYHADDEKGFLSLRDWVSLAWYHVVGTGNTDHFEAGCRVEQIRTWGGCLAYCAKYMSKADSENFMADLPAGRHWGVFNREFMPWAKMIELPLSDEEGVRLRRVARRYLEHRLGRRVQRHFGVTLYCDVNQFKRLLRSEIDCPF